MRFRHAGEVRQQRLRCTARQLLVTLLVGAACLAAFSLWFQTTRALRTHARAAEQSADRLRGQRERDLRRLAQVSNGQLGTGGAERASDASACAHLSGKRRGA